MHSRLELCVLGLLLAVSPCLAGPIYVSPSGNDAWTGEGANPVTGGTTGPKKTLPEALRLARVQRAAAPNATSPLVIILRGGTYELPATLALTAADSGTAASPLVIKAEANEFPILSGGTRLTPVLQGDASWVAAVPAAFQSAPFSQLYVGGERRQRVKMPKTGYYHVASSVNPGDPNARDAFQFAAGDVAASSRINEVVVRAFQNWSVYALQVYQYDGANRILTLSPPVSGLGRVPFDETFWYLLENVADAPLVAGEWYFDRTALQLRYAPRAGEVVTTSFPVAPRLETLVRLTGAAGSGSKIQNITFERLTFADTDWKLSATGLQSVQGAVYTPGAIEVSSARAIAFTGCTFRTTGAYGLVMGADVQSSSVRDSVFQNLGAGGMRIGSHDGADLNAPAQWTTDCVIQNNSVTGYGQVHPNAIGIWVGYARRTLIEHNEISDGYYSGISVGWVWDYGLYAARDNVVRQNRLWRLGQKVMSDLGGIYTLGEQPGTQIIGNKVSDVQGARYGGWGIYLDEGSSSISVVNNLVYNLGSSALHLHWGRDVTLTSNILALGQDFVFENTTPEQTGTYTLRNNVFVTQSRPFYGSAGVGATVGVSGNLYHSLDGALKLFPGNADLAAWKSREPDAAADNPSFANPLAGDFTTTRPDLLSARGIDATLYAAAGRSSGPVVPAGTRIWWDPAPNPQSIQFSANFDANGADEVAAWEKTLGSGAQSIQVSAERFHSAPNSLLVADAASSPTWLPLASRNVYVRNGYVHVSFWLWADRASIPWIALRDPKEPLTNGPVISVSADGNITASGTKVMLLPFESWVKIDIGFGIGATRTETWNLDITTEAGITKTIVGLPMPKTFINFDWFGITGNANVTAKFFLDDLEVKFTPQMLPPTNARLKVSG